MTIIDITNTMIIIAIITITMIIIVIIAIMELGPLGQRWMMHRGSLLLHARVKKPGPFIYYCTNNAAEVESSIDEGVC